MRRRLSSLQTFMMKIIFPFICFLIWGLEVVQVFFSRSINTVPGLKWFALVGGIAALAFVYWNCIRLKEISVDSKFLYVSNYIKEIYVPLSQIDRVTQSLWTNTHNVTIYLKSPCEFGDKIVFMPKARFFAFLSSHPVVEELRALARSSTEA